MDLTILAILDYLSSFGCVRAWHSPPLVSFWVAMALSYCFVTYSWTNLGPSSLIKAEIINRRHCYKLHIIMYQGKLQFIKAELVDPPLSEEAAFDNQCSICLDLATFPVRCSICKTIFCLRCASVWKSEHDSCPKKCQSPWTYELI